MNGIHDMGGMHGFGPMVIDVHDGPIVLNEWEKRAGVLFDIAHITGAMNLDSFRFGIEMMPPALYLETPYFGRWAYAAEWNLVRSGLIARDEVDAWMERLSANPDAQPVQPEMPPDRPLPAAEMPLPPSPIRFRVGDVVRARNIQPTCHHRMPRYVRGKEGVVTRVNPPEPLSDLRADFLPAPLEVTYHVEFKMADLWGEAAEPDGLLSIDLFDSYLEPLAGGGQ